MPRIIHRVARRNSPKSLRRTRSITLQPTEKLLFGPYRPPNTGQMHTWSVARRPFRTVSECAFSEVPSGENSDVRRLARVRAPHHPALPDDPVALERCEVCPDTVVRKIEFAGWLVDGEARPAQQRDHPPARALENLPVPACTHIVLPLGLCLSVATVVGKQGLFKYIK